MRFYESGDENKPTILLIPGTCCHWSIFDEVTPLLQERFHVDVVSFDGFDETEDTTYPTMEEEAERIEHHVRERYDGHVCCVYGCSLGGSYVAYLAQRGNIHFDHGILGSSDLDSANRFVAKMQSRTTSQILYEIVGKGMEPSWLQKRVERRKAEDPEMGAQMERFVHLFTHSPLVGKVTQESVYNQYYWDLVTPLKHGIDVPGTTIHVFYATQMGEKYEKRYRTYFAHPDIRRQDLNHETFFFCYPKEWTREVEDCCGLADDPSLPTAESSESS